MMGALDTFIQEEYLPRVAGRNDMGQLNDGVFEEEIPKENNKRYYYIKLMRDTFRQKEVKALRRIDGGDTCAIVYALMLLVALENNGILYYEGYGDDFPNELALELDEDEDAVRRTVDFLIEKGLLIKKNNAEYELITTSEMVGSETDAARRQRKSRARRRMIEAQNGGDL